MIELINFLASLFCSDGHAMAYSKYSNHMFWGKRSILGLSYTIGTHCIRTSIGLAGEECLVVLGGEVHVVVGERLLLGLPLDRDSMAY